MGIPTGFIDLDKMLGGLQKSDLIIIAARPGVGKTSLLLTIALNAARKFHQRVAIFSLELSNEEVVRRFVSEETGIDGERIKTGALRESGGREERGHETAAQTLMDCKPGDEVEVYEIGRCLVTGDAIGPKHDYRLIRRIVDGKIAVRFEPVPSGLAVSQAITLR